jgi:hypothetical protein
MGKPFFQTKIDELVGRELASVVFVRDYLQFCFDGPCLTALISPVFVTATSAVLPGSTGWRDGLCSAIGIPVTSVRFTEREELCIEFANASRIVIPLREQDYIGPEAINYFAEDGTLVVF